MGNETTCHIGEPMVKSLIQIGLLHTAQHRLEIEALSAENIQITLRLGLR